MSLSKRFQELEQREKELQAQQAEVAVQKKELRAQVCGEHLVKAQKIATSIFKDLCQGKTFQKWQSVVDIAHELQKLDPNVLRELAGGAYGIQRNGELDFFSDNVLRQILSGNTFGAVHDRVLRQSNNPYKREVRDGK